MKSEKILLFAVAGLFFLISGCQDEQGQGDYSGVSELISDRNRARHEVKENPPLRPSSPKRKTLEQADQTSGGSDLEPQKKDLSSIILYEENVEIVGSDSGRTMARGVAYINKKGQIVRIKIVKE